MTAEQLNEEIQDIESEVFMTLEEVAVGYAMEQTDNYNKMSEIADTMIDFVRTHAKDLHNILNGEPERVYEGE